jgi:hypothetical protein
MFLETVLFSNVIEISSLIGDKLPRSVVLKTLTMCAILFSKLDGILPTFLLDLSTLTDPSRSRDSLAKIVVSRSVECR